MSNILNDMAIGLERAELMASKLEGGFDSAKEKARVYGQFISEIFRLNLDDLQKLDKEGWQKLIGSIKEAKDAIEKYNKEARITNIVASGWADVISSIGTAMVDAEQGFRAMTDSILGMIEEIIHALLVKAFVAMISNESAKGLPGLIAAAVGIAAIKAMVSKSRADAKSASKMAKGGVVPEGYPNDSYPAMLSSGEAVIPPKALPNYKRDDKLHITVEGRVKGQDIHYIVKEIDRKYKGVY